MGGVRTDGRGGESGRERAGWARTVRGSWALVGAVVTVVLGPAAVTASALDRANAAPQHQAAEAVRPQAPERAAGTGT
ncbi:hypothetical protein [Streptomyces sp. NPDC017673]|uniref:hypothetical protein n=1 Tax=unclassified Streptomyces TaxID=2593676 RepID=UPI0037A637F1